MSSCKLSQALVALLFLLQSCVAAAGSGRCSAEQQVLFSCSTGRKTVSVCGSSDLSVGSAVVQYRFGRTAAAELVYPAADADWRQVTRGGRLIFSGGGGAYLVFANAPYRYIVYSAIGRRWGSKSGVVVEKSGKRVESLPCKGGTRSELGPDLFTKAGIAEDSDSFELP